MKKRKKNLNNLVRIGSSSLAIMMGVGLIYLLTNVGNHSKGPLEDFFFKIGDLVSDTENYFMSEKNKRYKKLKGLNKNSKEELLNPDIVLLGAFDNQNINDFQALIELEDTLLQTFPLIHIYSAWGSKLEQRFPLQKIKAIHELGSIPVLTWEPWLIDFDNEIHPDLRPVETRDISGLDDISNGLYDFYLEKWTEDLESIDYPVFIRWGHEMNDPYRYTWGPQNNKPESFVKAWKYVVDFFRNKGIENVIWIWSPHIAYGQFNEYYPGTEYVDWIGVGTLNYGTVATWSQWWTFDEIFGNHYDSLAQFEKPLMLSEFGSLAVGGDRAEWYKGALCDITEKYPELKSILFFHYNEDNTLTYQTLDWYIKYDLPVISVIRDCLDNSSVEIKPKSDL